MALLLASPGLLLLLPCMLLLLGREAALLRRLAWWDCGLLQGNDGALGC
jgi:hypothetical protein